MCIWKKRRISKINRHENNIGNHAAAVKDSGGVASRTEYAAYGLNRHASVGDFVPQFDADGNQTLLKTETAVWQVDYNAEKRPVRFTRVEGTSTTVVECAYDFMGRRAYKKVAVNGSVTLHQRYIYRGYLQIAALDLTRAAHPALWYITWDPTQPVATRPLAIQKDGTWYPYGWDLTKNICEVYGPAGYIRTAYTYAPYGEVASEGDVTQPIQWSSEHNDTELGLIYYNYRHYNPVDGRWLGRDMIHGYNLYSYVLNETINNLDIRGQLYTISNEPIIKMVSKSEMKGRELGKFDNRVVAVPSIYGLFGIIYVDVPNERIVRKIMLVSDDSAYMTTHRYMKIEKGDYTIEKAKEKVKNHELNHFKSFKYIIMPYVKDLNSYDGFNCIEAHKLLSYFTAYRNYIVAYVRLEGVKQDIKDYYGNAREERRRELSLYEAKYNKMKGIYEKHKRSIKNQK